MTVLLLSLTPCFAPFPSSRSLSHCSFNPDGRLVASAFCPRCKSPAFPSRLPLGRARHSVATPARRSGRCSQYCIVESSVSIYLCGTCFFQTRVPRIEFRKRRPGLWRAALRGVDIDSAALVADCHVHAPAAVSTVNQDDETMGKYFEPCGAIISAAVPPSSSLMVAASVHFVWSSPVGVHTRVCCNA